MSLTSLEEIEMDRRVEIESSSLLNNGEVIYEIVEYSEDQLFRYVQEIVDNIDNLKDKGINITKVYYDFPKQKVVVALDTLNSYHQDLIQSMFDTVPLEFEENQGLVQETARNTYSGGFLL
ncbi:hypothetical protein [Paenibacillus sp. 453mf]|uniref:hypothetical protein n=1 Tax=Paenibacillus sp. 453mf TaxID=1761874 RepID=UPI0008E31E3D|nr:hypothetical protein [Paenibacillus sp. 453mf]SFS77770.1 hypothetical protein SAMN04488601_103186 [Paenibacillus sp. 453mf]